MFTHDCVGCATAYIVTLVRYLQIVDHPLKVPGQALKAKLAVHEPVLRIVVACRTA